MEMNYVIPAKLVQSVVDILGRLPFNDVAPTMLQLTQVVTEQNKAAQNIDDDSKQEKTKKD